MYKCSSCGKTTNRWNGKCLACKAWSSLEKVAEDNIKLKKGKRKRVEASAKVRTLASIEEKEDYNEKISTGIKGIDSVLGGGVLFNQFLLIGGEPGIGKSTLILQICLNLANNNKKVLYISGEETIHQIKNRVNRIYKKSDNVLENFNLLNENKLEIIIETIKKEEPFFVVVDSVQTCMSLDSLGAHGSPSQIRYVADCLMEVAKTNKVAICLIGHVTKEGELAGPKTLEHIVDTVLNLEGDRFHTLRILRSSKNRFGAVDEVALFNISELGFREVDNFSKLILKQRQKNSLGSAITCAMEGSRPLILEIQALSNITNFGYPKRTSAGVKLNKLQLLIAVLQKYSNIKLENQDVYSNIIGGINVSDPGIDLAVMMALASSYLKKPLSNDLAFLGEVSLSGEIRLVSNIERRVKELKKAGFETIICPKFESKIPGVKKLALISEVIKEVF